MPEWMIAPFVLGMFWLSVFLGTLAEWRAGRDLFDGGDPPVVGPTAGGTPDRPPPTSVVAIVLCVLCVPAAVVLMVSLYLAARACIRLWQGQVESGGAADRGRPPGSS